MKKIIRNNKLLFLASFTLLSYEAYSNKENITLIVPNIREIILIKKIKKKEGNIFY
jgi:hypothetical protein